MISKEDIPKELYDKVLRMQKDKGKVKYGHSLVDCPKESFNWFIMILEEVIDCYQYIEKLKECKEGIEIIATKKGAILYLYGKKVHLFKTVYDAEKFVKLVLI